MNYSAFSHWSKPARFHGCLLFYTTHLSGMKS